MILGTTYKDKITGFTGVCTGFVTYITGCNQALVQPKSKDGDSYPEPQWVDAQRLERVEGDTITLDNGPNPGFGKAAPIR